MNTFVDTQDYLLSLVKEKAPINLRTSSVHEISEPGIYVTRTPIDHEVPP